MWILIRIVLCVVGPRVFDRFRSWDVFWRYRIRIGISKKVGFGLGLDITLFLQYLLTNHKISFILHGILKEKVKRAFYLGKIRSDTDPGYFLMVGSWSGVSWWSDPDLGKIHAAHKGLFQLYYRTWIQGKCILDLVLSNTKIRSISGILLTFASRFLKGKKRVLIWH